MTGQKCGSLLVICREASVNKLAAWRCRCECGKEVIATGSDLRQGKIKTCGCRIGIKTRRNWQGTGNIPKNYWSCLNKNAIQRSILKLSIWINYMIASTASVLYLDYLFRSSIKQRHWTELTIKKDIYQETYSGSTKILTN